MSDVIEKRKRHGPQSRVTLSSLQTEVIALRQRVEDLEDLRELNQAIERNGSKPLVSWSKGRKGIGLD